MRDRALLAIRKDTMMSSLQETSLGGPETATRPPETVDQVLRKKSPVTARRAMVAWSFLLPFAVLFTVSLIIPMIVGVRNSFFTRKSSGGGLFGGGEMVDHFVGLENYVAAATNSAFWSGMGRVLGYGLWQIPIMIGCALVLALLLDSLLVRRVGGFRLAYFVPFAIPGVVGTMIWMYLYNPNLSPFMQLLPDWLNFMSPRFVMLAIGNVVWWQFVGFNMLVFLAALQAIPRELYDAARIDGASGLQIALRVKIPLLRNSAILTILLSIIGTIQLFGEPVIFATTNPWITQTFTPMMMAYGSQVGLLVPGGPGPGGAISVMMALVAGLLAAIFVLIQKKLVK
ncbi:carbohydrate ABC transporter permease [Promicromonospora sp. NPDC057488]|uniref:carbohydrate ABC transporter permease n=1 Tax=Promicromonospora sp. NPDC057488 TaxID=3346147 RepID=UPI003673422C